MKKITVGLAILCIFTSHIFGAEDCSKKLTIQSEAGDLIDCIKSLGAKLQAIEEEHSNTSESIQKLMDAKLLDLPYRLLPIGGVIAHVRRPDNKEVITSLMEEDKRREIAENTVWILANGADVRGSKYAKKIGEEVPDLTGLFLRGIDPSGEPKRDPDSDRRPGDIQNFATALPSVPFNIVRDGNHTHNYLMNRSSTVPGPRTLIRSDGQPENGSLAGNASGIHGHSISGGDKETRPINAAVWFYIRIN